MANAMERRPEQAAASLASRRQNLRLLMGIFGERATVEATERALRRTPPPPYGEFRPTPVFVVGMARTGATLVEQIIASHPYLSAARIRSTESRPRRRTDSRGDDDSRAETSEARPRYAHGLGDGSKLTQRLAALRDDVVEAAGETTDEDPSPLGAVFAAHAADVWRDMLADAPADAIDAAAAATGFPDGLVVVDKLLANLHHLIFIHLCFPDAPIILTTRDPLAAIFSGFAARTPSLATSHDVFDVTAEYARAARSVLAFATSFKKTAPAF